MARQLSRSLLFTAFLACAIASSAQSTASPKPAPETDSSRCRALPSRFFHTSAFSSKYQNKIARSGIGVGYSYALSPFIVKETVAAVPAGTRVFFDVDHWDSSQDDLRRFMELDAENRRFMILESMSNARKGSASFEPPLDTCGGCTPRSVVVDVCEKPPNASPNYSEYNAIRCGDITTIKQALQMRR